MVIMQWSYQHKMAYAYTTYNLLNNAYYESNTKTSADMIIQSHNAHEQMYDETVYGRIMTEAIS